VQEVNYEESEKKLFMGLFIAMTLVLVIDTAISIGNSFLTLGIINSIVLAGIGLYFLVDWLA
jgi:hypothetical protein